MKLTIWGAARQVTGSMHLLQLPGGYNLLVDCGLDYDQQKRFGSLSDIDFPFSPAMIDAVILTHAHIDHSGNLPTLVKHGFNGQIICTPATADITGLLLADSLNIMESERQKRTGRGRKKTTVKTPYTLKHLKQAVSSMVTVELGKPFSITPEAELTFYNAGHILGAVSAFIKVEVGGRETRIGFTGDLGNYGGQLVPDPQAMPEVDYLVTESTYGGRKHIAQRTPGDELLHYTNLACVDYPGRLIIPAFSVGRTHAIAFTFHQLFRQGKLPRVKIFVDSPLAIKTAKHHHKFVHTLSAEAQEFYRQYNDLFEFDQLEFVPDAKDSDWLKHHNDPCIIISAAGMVEGGRIQQHIRDNISNPKAHILIAGFCAEGTLGYRLLQGQPTVAIKNRELPVFSPIHKTDAFSAHPDNEGLIRYIKQVNGTRTKKILLVHGEEASMTALQKNLAAEGLNHVEIPQKGQVFVIE
jgi:metallo-beta-lactamase family protein